MQNYKVISKGKCINISSESPVVAQNYIIARKNNDKVLLLRLLNTRQQVLDDLQLTVLQYDDNGNFLESVIVSLEALEAQPKSVFSTNEDIKLNFDCSQIKVKITSARYGASIYNNDKYGVSYNYDTNAKNHSAQSKASVLAKFWNLAKKQYLLALMCFGLIVSIILFSFVMVNVELFKASAVSFRVNGVEYRFVDNDKSEESDIYISGYHGVSSTLVIPEYIDKHKVVYVANNAFENNQIIKSITFQHDLVIKSGAFKGCTNLTTVVLGDVSAIENNAFENSGITSLNSTKLSSIGDGAFTNCTNLQTVELVNDSLVLKLGSIVFAGCNKLKTVVIDQPCDFKSVSGLFSGNVSLTSLSLKNFGRYDFDDENTRATGTETVTSMFDGELSELSLQSLYIENLYQIVPNFCANLPFESIEIANLQQYTISANAFDGCTKLTEITLPQGITEIGNYAFRNTALTSFDLNTVINLGNGVFYGSALTSLELPATINIIGKGILGECNSLQSFTTPFIGANAKGTQPFAYFFDVNYGNDASTVPASLEQVTITSATQVYARAFQDCKYIRIIKLNDEITTIGSYAFSGASNLHTIQLPQNLKTISSQAFANCFSLKTITLPSTLTKLDNTAFLNCFKLYEVWNFSELTIESTDNIAKYALKVYNPGDASVPRLTKEGYTVGQFDTVWYMIGYPVGAEEINLPDFMQITEYRIPYNLFRSDMDIVSLNVAKSVAQIGDNAVRDCTNLKELSFADKSALTYVGSWAFGNDTNLQSAMLPNTVQTISANAFYNNTALQKAAVPSAIKTIGSSAYVGCTRLYEVFNNSNYTLTSGDTAMGEIAKNAIFVYGKTDKEYAQFEKIDDITYAFFKDDVYVVETNLYLTNLNFEPYVYDGKEYSSYVLWNNAFSSNKELKSVTFNNIVVQISENVFYNCSSLSKVQFNNCSLTQLGMNAFRNCISLQRIELPTGLKTIGSNAFYGCNSLQFCSLSNTVQTIEMSAFRSCTALEEIKLGNALQSINDDAFYDCTALASITLPESLQEIKGNNTFFNCKNLSIVYNYSSLKLVKGKSDNGRVAEYATVVYNL